MEIKQKKVVEISYKELFEVFGIEVDVEEAYIWSSSTRNSIMIEYEYKDEGGEKNEKL